MNLSVYRVVKSSFFMTLFLVAVQKKSGSNLSRLISFYSILDIQACKHRITDDTKKRSEELAVNIMPYVPCHQFVP